MNEEAGSSATPTKQWIGKNLVTLGSAAVFSVYSAGYFRTREAADRFANDTMQRRSAAPARSASPDRAAGTRNHIEGSDAEKHVVIKPSSAKAGATADATPGVPAQTSTTAPGLAVAIAKEADPTPAPVPAPIPAPPPAAVAVVAAVAALAVDSAPKAPEKKEEQRIGWRDGTFYGWGTSRHGDIQAAVDIKNGKIIAAYISQCLTRYSCSWISMLPGQIVSRQSAECDYVSGATQSSNAFYYAITEALGKAK